MYHPAANQSSTQPQKSLINLLCNKLPSAWQLSLETFSLPFIWKYCLEKTCHGDIDPTYGQGDIWACLPAFAPRFPVLTPAVRACAFHQTHSMARPVLLVFENALRSGGSGSQLPFNCHLPLIALMTITVITILEHISCARNFNLNNNFAILEFSALICKQGSRFGDKVGNEGARMWPMFCMTLNGVLTSVFNVYNHVYPRYVVRGAREGRRVVWCLRPQAWASPWVETSAFSDLCCTRNHPTSRQAGVSGSHRFASCLDQPWILFCDLSSGDSTCKTWFFPRVIRGMMSFIWKDGV